MFRRELERVFVLLAKPVMVAAMDDVNAVALLASWFRFRTKSYGWLATAPRRLEFAISTYLEIAGQVGQSISPSMNASAKPMSANKNSLTQKDYFRTSSSTLPILEPCLGLPLIPFVILLCSLAILSLYASVLPEASSITI
jgi:hypothetical protein